MPDTFFLNVTYLCNERCVFCAAGLAQGPLQAPDRPRGVTMRDIEDWTDGRAPRTGDVVMIAGGEPTLHPDLPAMVAKLAADGAAISVFTNGLRLEDRRYAETLLSAGVGDVRISLFGAEPATHDAVTGRRGSFTRTLAALGTLAELQSDHEVGIEIRLLVSRQTSDENPAIADLIATSIPCRVRVSLNRLILSADARRADATISWAQARGSVNACMRRLRDAGVEVDTRAIPLCVLDVDNRAWAADPFGASDGLGASVHRLHYLDPFTAAGASVASVASVPSYEIATPDPCARCGLADRCGGVEGWYVDLFGVEGIEALPDTVVP